MGRTILVKHTSIGDKSEKTRKANDKSRQEEEVDIEEWKEATTEHGGESTEGNDDFDSKIQYMNFLNHMN